MYENVLQFNIYPYPSQNILTIDFEDYVTQLSIVLINELGQVIKEIDQVDILTIDMNDVINGVYFFNVLNNDKSCANKVIKQ